MRKTPAARQWRGKQPLGSVSCVLKAENRVYYVSGASYVTPSVRRKNDLPIRPAKRRAGNPEHIRLLWKAQTIDLAWPRSGVNVCDRDC
ncbi:hypothetical protein [Dyella sp. Tek66A03]|uniref:hypothetical protein n=1 Tax=Dyella sp. Tek66A03 TaxID=3458298 RepID=UPI00403ED2D0